MNWEWKPGKTASCGTCLTNANAYNTLILKLPSIQKASWPCRSHSEVVLKYQDYCWSAHCVQGVTATGLSSLRDPQFRVLSSMSKGNRGQTVTDRCTFQDQQRKDAIAPIPEPIPERHTPSPQSVETHSPSCWDVVFHWERSLGHSPHWCNLLKL